MAGATGAWTWHHSGFVVSDLEDAVSFYRRCFGYSVAFRADGMTDLLQGVTGLSTISGSLAQLTSPISGGVLELLQFSNVPADVDPWLPVVPGRAHAAFGVQDLDEAIEQLQEAGGSLCGLPTAFSECRAVYCKTPVFTVVELMEFFDPAHNVPGGFATGDML